MGGHFHLARRSCAGFDFASGTGAGQRALIKQHLLFVARSGIRMQTNARPARPISAVSTKKQCSNTLPNRGYLGKLEHLEAES